MFNVKCHIDIISQKDLFVELLCIFVAKRGDQECLNDLERSLLFFVFWKNWTWFEGPILVSPLATQEKLLPPANEVRSKVMFYTCLSFCSKGAYPSMQWGKW